MNKSGDPAINAPAYSGKPSVSRIGLVRALNKTHGSTVATSVSVADTPGNRRRGLLDRPELEEHEGLWIVPCESVHTVGMRYPIDLVYLDRKRRVVKIVESLAPYRMSLCLRAHSVIELAAGAARRSGTKIGHQLALAARIEN
jgi:uncharacterized membrane protein (UPF0127 family)